MTTPDHPADPAPEGPPSEPVADGIDQGESAWEPAPAATPSPDTHEDDAPQAPPGDDATPSGHAADGEAAPEAAHEDVLLDRPTPLPAAPGARSGLVRPLAAAVALLLLLTAFLAYRVVETRGPAPVEASRTEALAAGREAARLVFSYDYRKLDKDFKAAQAVTTGKFRKDYESTTKKLVGDVAPRYKAVLVADVSEASVITAAEDRVLLLVFLNVQSTSSLTTGPKITPRRLKMTMQRQDDRWLVADVDAF